MNIIIMNIPSYLQRNVENAQEIKTLYVMFFFFFLLLQIDKTWYFHGIWNTLALKTPPKFPHCFNSSHKATN